MIAVIQCAATKRSDAGYLRQQDGTKVTFDWKDDAGDHKESHVFGAGKPAPWELKTGKQAYSNRLDGISSTWASPTRSG